MTFRHAIVPSRHLASAIMAAFAVAAVLGGCGGGGGGTVVNLEYTLQPGGGTFTYTGSYDSATGTYTPLAGTTVDFEYLPNSYTGVVINESTSNTPPSVTGLPSSVSPISFTGAGYEDVTLTTSPNTPITFTVDPPNYPTITIRFDSPNTELASGATLTVYTNDDGQWIALPTAISLASGKIASVTATLVTASGALGISSSGEYVICISGPPNPPGDLVRTHS